MPIERVSPFDSHDSDTYHKLNQPGAKRVLAEGDSWLSIFLPRDGNLFTWLQSRHDVVLLDLSYPGDTLADMANGRQFDLFRRLTNDEQHGWQYSAIFLNGGGNDVIGEGLDAILSASPGGRRRRRSDGVGRVNEQVLTTVLNAVNGHFRKFIRSRNDSAINDGCPIVVCNYDFVTPRDCGAQLLGVPLKGPWIYPTMIRHGIRDPEEQKIITDYLLKAFHERVLTPFSEDPANNFHVIHTQGTLDPAKSTDTSPTGDWADEIHPSAQGWAKLSKRVGPGLDSLLDNI